MVLYGTGRRGGLYGTGTRNGVIRNKMDSVVCSRMEGWFLMEQEGVKVFL